MKWSVIGLMLFGVVAALSATVLVASLRADNTATQVAAREPEEIPVPEVDILVAATDMPAMARVDANSLIKKTVLEEFAKPGYFSDVSQIAGRVLQLPVVTGQVLTPECFAKEGSLAPYLPKGMRAVSVSLANHAAMVGILRPGSVVDVLVSLKTEGEAMSVTILESVQVLAIAADTVVSSEDDGAGDRSSRGMVTLMLTSRQAQMLQLATLHGNLLLAMRSPADDSAADRVGVRLGELLPEFLAHSEPEDEPVEEPQVATEQKPVRWEVVVLRGGAKETQMVPMSHNGLGQK